MATTPNGCVSRPNKPADSMKPAKILTALLPALLACTVHAHSACTDSAAGEPRMRVVIDNDFAGDPDGLFQLVHHLLSPSVDIRGIIGSHLTPAAGFGARNDSAARACEKAHEVLRLLGLDDAYRVVKGADEGMRSDDEPRDSDGARLIIEEAMRDDVSTPLYVVCGASLTNIASALLLEPAIAGRLTLVWIGGQEYGDAAPPPGGSMPEYNLGLSVPAAQAVFNRSEAAIWQVPRNAYRQCIYSLAEMRRSIEPCGEIGKYLFDSTVGIMERLRELGRPMGEVYILGDTPLVLLTALQTGFEPDPASCGYTVRQAPAIAADGSYAPNPHGRPIRVYDRLDTRLMLRDFEAKLALLAAKQD